MLLNLKKNAVFIADSHFNDKNRELLNFLNLIIEKKINSSQIFFMGDIFDFLSFESAYFRDKNKKIIDLINKISKETETIYLEGNHDYNLQKLFPKVKVIKREYQALFCQYKNKKIAIAHGDIFTPWHYNLYCKIIRNSYFLKFLNILDFNNFLSKQIEKRLLKKNICKKMKNFEDFAKKRIAFYKDVNIIIEGHFHQGKSFSNKDKLYLNIPSLCCSKEYVLFDEKFKGVKL